jgi:hypothetical protein
MYLCTALRRMDRRARLREVNLKLAQTSWVLLLTTSCCNCDLEERLWPESLVVSIPTRACGEMTSGLTL